MHFLLMVIGDHPERQLAPYSAASAPVPVVDTALTPEIIVEQLQETIQRLQMLDDDPDLLATAEALNGLLEDILQLGYQEGGRRHLDLFQDFMLDRFDCELDEQLRPVRTCNPQAMFDSHVMGGGWSGRLKLRPGASGKIGTPLDDNPPKPGFVDQCTRQDLDLEGSREAVAFDAAQCWDEEWKRVPHSLPFGQKRDAYIQAARQQALLPEGVMENGQYYASADFSPDEWVKRVDQFFREMPPDSLITLYDCHI